MFWKDADIFVFPTLNETFGLVAVEAMEYEIPVVASTEGGIQDIIDNGNSAIRSRKPILWLLLLPSSYLSKILDSASAWEKQDGSCLRKSSLKRCLRRG